MRAGTDSLLGLRMVDTGSGYNSQNVKPVHVATRNTLLVDIQVTTMSDRGRVEHFFRNVDVDSFTNRVFEARVTR